MKNFIQEFVKTSGRHGVMNASVEGIIKVVNKIFPLKILSCVVLSETNSTLFELDSKYQHGFLSADKLDEFSRYSENELPVNFLSLASSKGDQCYCITDDGKLASYGWYSNNDTLTDIQNLTFCFDPTYVYMYKGLTTRDYRGQRLHAIGMNYALDSILKKGHKGIISYIESTNFDSLKSCYRLGYKYVGSIAVFRLFGTCFVFPSYSCQELNVGLRKN